MRAFELKKLHAYYICLLHIQAAQMRTFGLNLQHDKFQVLAINIGNPMCIWAK